MRFEDLKFEPIDGDRFDCAGACERYCILIEDAEVDSGDGGSIDATRIKIYNADGVGCADFVTVDREEDSIEETKERAQRIAFHFVKGWILDRAECALRDFAKEVKAIAERLS